MKNREEAYIGIELETHSYPEDLGQCAMDDILNEGIEISADELYQFIYDNGYNCDEDKLKMMLDEHDSADNMLYPLDCIYDKDTSYSDWLDYKSERDEEIQKREEKFLQMMKAPKKKTPSKK